MPQRNDSLLDRFTVLSAASVIAAHANSADTSFRQKDVRFLLELFSNWIEHSIGGSVLSLQNTQIKRYLESLVAEGLCSKSSRSKTPHYSLQRVGVIELLERVTNTTSRIQPELTFFSLYFVFNYRDRLWQLVEQEGKRFPLALRIELESLLDYNNHIDKCISQAEIELRKLRLRIDDARKAATLSDDMFSKGLSLEEIAESVEREFPYELNSQKPLSELVSGLQHTHGVWELTQGTTRRCVDLWIPCQTILTSYIDSLRSLKAQNVVTPSK